MAPNHIYSQESGHEFREGLGSRRLRSPPGFSGRGWRGEEIISHRTPLSIRRPRTFSFDDVVGHMGPSAQSGGHRHHREGNQVRPSYSAQHG